MPGDGVQDVVGGMCPCRVFNVGGTLARILLSDNSSSTPASNEFLKGVSVATTIPASEGLGERFAAGLFFWVVFMVFAISLNLLATFYFKPPQRTWPKKRPVCGLLPWSVVGSMLGYGFIHWHTGEPVSLVEFLFERHELLQILKGDHIMISPRLRSLCVVVNMMSQLSLAIAFTAPDGATEAVGLDGWGDFVVQLLILVGNIAMLGGIHMSALAAEANDDYGKSNTYKNLFIRLSLSLTAFLLIGSLVTVELKRQFYGTVWYVVYWSYFDLFLRSIAFAWVYAQPAVIYVTWRIGYYLYQSSSDHWNLQRLLINSKLKQRAIEAKERVAKKRLARMRGETYDEGSTRYEGSNPLAEQRRRRMAKKLGGNGADTNVEDGMLEGEYTEDDIPKEDASDEVDITLARTDSESSLYNSSSNDSTDLDTSEDEGGSAMDGPSAHVHRSR